MKEERASAWNRNPHLFPRARWRSAFPSLEASQDFWRISQSDASPAQKMGRPDLPSLAELEELGCLGSKEGTELELQAEDHSRRWTIHPALSFVPGGQSGLFRLVTWMTHVSCFFQVVEHGGSQTGWMQQPTRRKLCGHGCSAMRRTFAQVAGSMQSIRSRSFN